MEHAQLHSLRPTASPRHSDTGALSAHVSQHATSRPGQGAWCEGREAVHGASPRNTRSRRATGRHATSLITKKYWKWSNQPWDFDEMYSSRHSRGPQRFRGYSHACCTHVHVQTGCCVESDSPTRLLCICLGVYSLDVISTVQQT